MRKSMNNAFISERRSNERINCKYSAIVQGNSQNGEEFEEIARVKNLSTGGAYLLINRKVEVGQRLSLRIVLPTGSLEFGSSRLSINAANVLRTELVAKDVLGVAINFQNYRFL